LSGDFDAEQLRDFFLTQWRPTPLVSPWNSGSGFKQEKNPSAVAALLAVAQSTNERLGPYRVTIAEGRRVYADAVAQGWDKRSVVEECRNRLPDEALAWLDASVVLTTDNEVFPPLLGTGGNDGRFDFTIAYMARLVDVLGSDGNPTSRSGAWLDASLFARGPTPLLAEAVGQFDPGAAGGVNASSVGTGQGLVNPWDWLLCLEGALAFASTSARRLGATTRGHAAIPFTLGPAPAGYATASRDESSRGELWTPLWSGWASAREVIRLLGEGRIEWQGTQAANGLDGARALASLGVDRGITSFVRHALLSRNGLATLAVPVGRLVVQRRAEVPLTGQLDAWLGAVRRGPNPPGAVRSALGRLEAALFDVSVRGGRRRLQDVLICAAELDAAVGRTSAFRERAAVAPLLLRDAEGWFVQLDDGTPEFQLAAGFASLRDRITEGAAWADRATLGRLVRPLIYDARSGRIIWSQSAEEVRGLGVRPLLHVLADAHVRRVIAAVDRPNLDDEEVELVGVQPAYDYGDEVPLCVAAALLRGEVDLRRVQALLIALIRLDWATPREPSRRQVSVEDLDPVPAALALMAPHYLRRGQSLPWRSARDASEVRLHLRAQWDWTSRLRFGHVAPVLDAATTRLRLAGVDIALGRRPRARAHMEALASDVDGAALAAASLLRLRPADLLRALRRLAPSDPTPQPDEETA
jgi:CRISPR-associated protein Csx17